MTIHSYPITYASRYTRVGHHRKRYTDANGQIKINKGFSENLTDPVFPLFSAIYVRHWMRRGMGRLRDGSVRDD